MKSVSIVGCGWLGMSLGAELVRKGYSVKGSSRTAAKGKTISSYGMIPFVVDLNNSGGLPQEFFQTDILVLNIPPSNADSEASYLYQLETVLDIINPMDTNILFVSSTGVYANINREVSEEDADELAKSRSGITLLKAERKFWSEKNTIVRFGGLIGENRHPGRWFASKTGLKGGKTPINMIHREDCIGAIHSIIEQRCWGEVFNVCHPEHPSKSDYYRFMSKELGLESPSFDMGYPEDWKIVSSEKFQSKTSYEFQKSIWDI